MIDKICKWSTKGPISVSDAYSLLAAITVAAENWSDNDSIRFGHMSRIDIQNWAKHIQAIVDQAKDDNGTFVQSKSDPDHNTLLKVLDKKLDI